MLTQPFLTDLDKRADVKGSVDPLGETAIWSRLGRRVIGNLSTVTTSVRDFKTLVLGFALLKDLRRDAGPEGDSDDLANFLRWEQVAAYTRGHLNQDFSFRGVRRVQRRLSEGTTVPISAERDCQILGNQKVYGLWGLFTVPSRASGLLEQQVNELTQSAEEFVDVEWRRSLTPVWGMLLRTVRQDARRFNLERYEPELKRLRGVWRTHTASERPFWIKHLVCGGPKDKTEGRQGRLAEILKGTQSDSDFVLSQRSVRQLAKQAQRVDCGLSEALLDIAACESVLAPAAALFGYLQTLDRQSVPKAAACVRKSWPARLGTIDRDRFAGLQPYLAAATGSQILANEWLALSEELSEGRWDEAIARLLSLNKQVMGVRGGAAWVVDENGTFRVRYRDEAGVLPESAELKDLWRNPYFIGSLRTIVAEVGVA